MSHILALDQGTSSSRSIVFDAQGRIVAQAQRELTQHFPQPGWVEHDPMEIWATQLATAQQAIAQAGLTASDIRAIGITNQRETTLLWNRRTGKPLHHAIVWQDRRTAPFCAQLRAQGLEPMVQRATGLRIDPLLFFRMATLPCDCVQCARLYTWFRSDRVSTVTADRCSSLVLQLDTSHISMDK